MDVILFPLEISQSSAKMYVLQGTGRRAALSVRGLSNLNAANSALLTV